MGAIHAAVAPLSTKIIDDVAYAGVDVRKNVRSIAIKPQFAFVMSTYGRENMHVI